MKKNVRCIFVWVVLVIVCVGLTPIKSQAGSTTEPIGEILLAEINDLTGPTSDSCKPHHDFLTSLTRYWNDQGGMPYKDPKTGKEERVKFRWIWGDNKAQAGPCPTIYKRLMGQKPLFMMLGSSAAVSTVGDWCNRDKIPTFFGAPPYEPRMEQLEYAFCPQPPHYSTPTVAAKWVMQEWKKMGKKGSPKWAWYTLDIPFGRTVLRPELQAYMKDIGIDIVGSWFIPFRPVDCTPDLLSMKEKNVDYTYGSLVVSQEYVIMKDITTLNLKDKLQVISCPYGITERLLELAGEGANGIIGVLHSGLPSELEKPGVAFTKQLAEQYNLSFEMDSLTGVAIGKMMLGAVKKALEVNGYPITREDLKNAFESLRDFSTGGCYPPITFTPKEHRGSLKSRIITVRDGKIIALTDYIDHADLSPFIEK
ncbi:MAG: ABC transporter substrate-binding protein [Methanomassiliicoccales archaeon]|nr:MAG: ABC transporter substrate-binding protein [Methanomassiliicoccales archaeon]